MHKILQYITFVISITFIGSPTLSNDYTISQGKLSNRNFFRAIVCKAPSDKPCQANIWIWPKHKSKKLTIGLVQTQKGFPKTKVAPIIAGVENAIKQVNNLNASIHLSFIKDESNKKPDIHIYLLGTKRGEKMALSS